MGHADTERGFFFHLLCLLHPKNKGASTKDLGLRFKTNLKKLSSAAATNLSGRSAFESNPLNVTKSINEDLAQLLLLGYNLFLL